MHKSLKATWAQALLTFFAPILLVFTFRWALFEPYVIPSGSMIPTLLIHDHILVNKWAYGFRLPFTETWLKFWKKPRPGDIVVFRYPQSPETFFVKRVVAIEGDTIEVIEGQIIRNGQMVSRKEIQDGSAIAEFSESFRYYQEKLERTTFVSRSFRGGGRLSGTKQTVPPGHFFVVGDNRDESSDSRSWGFVPYENLIGRAGALWLSCENTLPAAPFICDPKSIRWKRLFTSVH
jgi:signal peptidase I